jgi:hypothetical protein
VSPTEAAALGRLCLAGVGCRCVRCADVPWGLRGGRPSLPPGRSGPECARRPACTAAVSISAFDGVAGAVPSVPLSGPNPERGVAECARPERCGVAECARSGCRGAAECPYPGRSARGGRVPLGAAGRARRAVFLLAPPVSSDRRLLGGLCFAPRAAPSILDLWCRNCRCVAAFAPPLQQPKLQDRRGPRRGGGDTGDGDSGARGEGRPGVGEADPVIPGRRRHSARNRHRAEVCVNQPELGMRARRARPPGPPPGSLRGSSPTPTPGDPCTSRA